MPRKRHKPQKLKTHNHSKETRASEAITIAWMLTAISTLGCVLASWIAAGVGMMQESGEELAEVADFLLLAATIVGVLSLLLAVVTQQVRRVKPPQTVTVVATLIGAVPLVIVLFRMLS
jgi:hypothetical protein